MATPKRPAKTSPKKMPPAHTPAKPPAAPAPPPPPPPETPPIRPARAAAKDSPKPTGILIVGSLNMDLVIRTETMPQPGQTVLGSNLVQTPGGKGANQAAAAGRLAQPVAAPSTAAAPAGGPSAGTATKSRPTIVCRMIGRTGNDPAAQIMTRTLLDANIDTSSIIKTPDAPSGAALIIIDRHGENAIVVSGANALLTPDDLLAHRAAFALSSVLLTQLESPPDTISCAAALIKQTGGTVILDPAPAPPEGIPEALYHVDILTPNQLEAQILTGVVVKTPFDAIKAGERLLARGTKTVVLKIGAQGAMIVGRNEPASSSAAPRPAGDIYSRHIPGFKVPVVDTTAAGDCFNGALAVALAENKPLSEAVRFANAAGALACTKLGAQAAIPTRAEVEALLKKYP